MQPHSMCAVALAGYVWNKWEIKERARTSKDPIKLSSCEMKIEYRLPDGQFRNLGYRLSNISVEKNTKVSVDVAKSHGSLHCSVIVERTSEGSEINIYHSEHHASGLKEKFNIYTESVVGRHENSLKYGNYRGNFGNDFEKLVLACGILRDRGTSNARFIDSTYTLEMTSRPEIISKSEEQA